jgi:hypothetical protein
MKKQRLTIAQQRLKNNTARAGREMAQLYHEKMRLLKMDIPPYEKLPSDAQNDLCDAFSIIALVYFELGIINGELIR